MNALAVEEIESGPATLSPVAERLTLKEAAERISKVVGKKIYYSRMRAMWSQNHSAILVMKQHPDTKLERGDWQIPVEAVDEAARMWPRDRAGAEPVAPETADVIVRLRIPPPEGEGLTYAAIAQRLQAMGVPVRSGHGRWEPKTVQWIVSRTLRERGLPQEAARRPLILPRLPEQTVELILRLRKPPPEGEGLTYQAIARRLQELGVLTKKGGTDWAPKTIHYIVTRALAEKTPPDPG